MTRKANQQRRLNLFSAYRSRALSSCLLLLAASIVLGASCTKRAAPEEERPFMITMQKRKWLESEAITMTLTLKPPPETTCLLSVIDAHNLKISVTSDRGRSLSWPNVIIDYEVRAVPRWAPIERENLESISFGFPLSGPFELAPGRYRAVAFYDARSIGRGLAVTYPLVFGCEEEYSKELRHLRLNSCLYHYRQILQQWDDCFKSHGFLRGPFQSNTLEFEVLPDKSRRSGTSNKSRSMQ
jgi:hypothetical protein